MPDTSTVTATPKKNRLARFLRVAAPVLLVSLTVAFFAMPPAWRTLRDVTTGQTAAYPSLQPHVYDMEPDQTVILAAAAASRLPGWRVVRTDRETGAMTARVAGFPGATEEVTAEAQPLGPGSDRSLSRVVIRSRSLSGIGPGDWGANARHIRALQAAMDDKLPLARP